MASEVTALSALPAPDRTLNPQATNEFSNNKSARHAHMVVQACKPSGAACSLPGECCSNSCVPLASAANRRVGRRDRQARPLQMPLPVLLVAKPVLCRFSVAAPHLCCCLRLFRIADVYRPFRDRARARGGNSYSQLGKSRNQIRSRKLQGFRIRCSRPFPG